MKSASPNFSHMLSQQRFIGILRTAKSHMARLCVLMVLTILGLLFALAGCGEEAPVLAQIGDVALRRPDFDAFVGNLSPVDQRNSRSAPVTYLQSMVDRELLLLEADEYSLADDPQITEQLRFEVRARLAEVFQMRVLTAQLEITEIDVEREFENSRLNHERLLRRILVRTEDDLNLVVTDLAAGRSFVEVLEPFATNDAIAEGDGVVGQMPNLGPGEEFSYNSYHVARGSGHAEGSFFGLTEEGRRVFVRIPRFKMKLPEWA